MLITNPKGLYTLNLDTARRVVFEVNVGSWTKEDYAGYHAEYVNKIIPALGNQPWAICSDLRKYKLSDLADEIRNHAEWMSENNLKYGAIVVDSAIVKMQLNRAVSGKVDQQAFLDEKEASDWLKSKGF